jgi:hypothetical protein
MPAESSPSVLKTSSSVYDDLEPRLQDDLRVRADRIRQSLTRTTLAVVEAGRDLLAAKDQLDHGQFAVWIETEIGVNIRTAQRFMSVARWAEDKSDTVSLLSPTAVYLLAAKSTPAEVSDKVVELAAAGGPLPDDRVLDLVREAKHQRTMAEAEARLTPARRRRKHSARRQAEWQEQRAKEERERKQEISARAEAIIDRFTPDDVAFLVKMLNIGDIWELRNCLSERVQAGLRASGQEGASPVEVILDATAAPDLVPTIEPAATPPEGKLTWSTPTISEIDPADAGRPAMAMTAVSEAVQPLAEDGCAMPDIPAFLRRTPPSSVAPGDSPAVSPAPPARAATREAAE